MITIVTGLPRSGTSLMMQMLEAGGMPVLADGVRGADLDNPRGYYELEKVKRLDRDATWLNEAEGKAFKLVYLLLYDLPRDREYKALFMERNLGEVIASQNAMLARRGSPGGERSDAEWRVLFTRELANARHWLAEQPNFKVLYVNYNELLAAPEAGLESVARFLERPLDTQAMRTAIDASLYRHRQD